MSEAPVRRGAPEASRPIVPLKIRPPTLRVDVIRRPRLTERLDRTEARVVLVSAPAGFGKSVLILDWLRAREHPPVWLSVDALDNDPGRFFSHLAEALRRHGDPGLLAAGDAMLRSVRADRDPAEATLSALEGVASEAVVVFDDVHLLEAPAAWTFLGQWVAQAPPYLRLVFLTREDPPLRLGRLRMTGDVLEIRERELRFREDESSEFFQALPTGGLSPAAVSRLVTRTEGWAAGLRMAAVALASAPDAGAAVDAFGGAHELLVDYLLEEVLRGRDDTLQRFLMETSILPRFTADTCRHVTGDPRAAERLEAVEEANLFLTSLDPQRRWFRYHQLFAELLTFRLERLDPDRIPTLRRRAAEWFEGHDDLTEALAQASLLPDREMLVALLDRHGYAMLARSEFGAFQRWLEQVPDPDSAGWPMFLAAVAWYRAQTDRGADLDPLLQRIETAVAKPPPGYPPAAAAEADLHRRVIQAFRHRTAGRLGDALEFGREVLEDVPAGARHLRGMVEFHIAAVHLALAEMPAAEEHLERARRTTDRGGLPYIFLASLGHLGAVAAQTHGVPAARSRLDEAVALAESRGLDDLPAFGIVLYQLADVHTLANETEIAADLLDRAADLTRNERTHDIHGNVLLRLARLEELAGRPDRAHELLARAAALLRSQSLQPFGTTVELERIRLDGLDAGHLVDGALAGSIGPDEADWTLVRERWTILRMQAALREGRRDEAASLARQLEEQARPRRRHVALCLALLTRAADADTTDDRRRLFEEALDLAERSGYVRPLLDGGAPIRALLEASAGWALPERLGRFAGDRLLPHLPKAGVTVPRVAHPDLELTDREREILSLLEKGGTNRALAEALFLSENTVKTHLKHIYAKLDVSSRTAAVDRARRLGILHGRSE